MIIREDDKQIRVRYSTWERLKELKHRWGKHSLDEVLGELCERGEGED